MEKVWICVYRDTIEEHDEDNNLTDILVTMDFAERFFNECIATDEDNVYESFEEFLNEFTADDTMNFYDYAMKHSAIIQTANW